MQEFYELNWSKISLRERWWNANGNPLAFLLSLILGILHVKIPMASDDAAVKSTHPFVVAQLSADIEQHFAPLAAELAALGFVDPVYHDINDPASGCRIYWASYRHPSNAYIARIHNRYWDRTSKKERALFLMFISCFAAGGCVVSSSGKRDTEEPPQVEMIRMPKATTAALWAAHVNRVAQRAAAQPLASIYDRESMLQVTEYLHGLQRNFHLQRGVFRPRTAEETEKAQAFAQSVEQNRGAGCRYPEVMAEIIRIEEQKPKWSGAMWPLLISLIAFVASSGSSKVDWKITLWLVPILLLHETGHWIAMRVFGYRNLRMFFIPFFGAAVSGKHRNVAGWKKAVVSLAGPVPGILFGGGLLVAGTFAHVHWLQMAAFLMVFLNAYNLLPFLPLDGGRFLQAILFCRNRWLDFSFRAAAVAGLIVLGVLGLSRVLGYVAVALAVGLPLAFKISKITDHFRRHPLPPALPDETMIPQLQVDAITPEVKAVLPKAGAKIIAQHVINVYETLNARPPGLGGTIGLLAVYLGTILAAAVSVVIWAVGMSRGGFALMQPASHKVDAAAIQSWHGSAEQPGPAAGRNFVVVDSPATSNSAAFFQETTRLLPASAGALLLGDSIVAGFPPGDSAHAKLCLDRFRGLSTNASWTTNGSAQITLTFSAPSLEAATNLEETLRGSFDPWMTNLVLPWNPAAKAPEFAPRLRARQVFGRLELGLQNINLDPRLMAGRTALFFSILRRDTNHTASILSERETKLKQLTEDFRRDQLAAYAGTPYAPLAQYLFTRTDASGTNKAEIESLKSKAYAQLGPAAESALTEAVGSVSRSGLQFNFWLSFSDPETDIPQVVQWLTDMHCTQIKYDLTVASDDD